MIFDISDDFSYIVNLETFIAYCAVIAPSQYLYVSFPMIDMEGEKKEAVLNYRRDY